MKSWVTLFDVSMHVGDVEITTMLLSALVPPMGMPVEDWPTGEFTGPIVGMVTETLLGPACVSARIEWVGSSLPRKNWVTGEFILNPKDPLTGAVTAPLALRRLYLTDDPLYPNVGLIRQPNEAARRFVRDVLGVEIQPHPVEHSEAEQPTCPHPQVELVGVETVPTAHGGQHTLPGVPKCVACGATRHLHDMRGAWARSAGGCRGVSKQK